MWVRRTDREVFGHAFDEPKRQPQRRRDGRLAECLALTRHVELKRVDHLVTQHVVGLSQRTSERQHHAPLEDLGHTPSGFARSAANGVGLREMRMAGVINDRLPTAELMVQEARKPRIPALGKDAGLLHRLAFLGIEMDVEMFRLENLEIEALVLNLVATEILRAGSLHAGSAEGREKAEKSRQTNAGSAIHKSDPLEQELPRHRPLLRREYPSA